MEKITIYNWSGDVNCNTDFGPNTFSKKSGDDISKTSDIKSFDITITISSLNITTNTVDITYPNNINTYLQCYGTRDTAQQEGLSFHIDENSISNLSNISILDFSELCNEWKNGTRTFYTSTGGEDNETVLCNINITVTWDEGSGSGSGDTPTQLGGFYSVRVVDEKNKPVKGVCVGFYTDKTQFSRHPYRGGSDYITEAEAYLLEVFEPFSEISKSEFPMTETIKSLGVDSINYVIIASRIESFIKDKYGYETNVNNLLYDNNLTLGRLAEYMGGTQYRITDNYGYAYIYINDYINLYAYGISEFSYGFSWEYRGITDRLNPYSISNNSNCQILKLKTREYRVIRVMDIDANPVYGAKVQLYRSNDGGETFNIINGVYYYTDSNGEISESNIGSNYFDSGNTYVQVVGFKYESDYKIYYTSDILMLNPEYAVTLIGLKKKLASDDIPDGDRPDIGVIEPPKNDRVNVGPLDRFNEMSINYLKNSSNMEFRNLKGNMDTSYSIRVVDPDSVSTYDVFTTVPVMMDDNEKSVIGSVDIALKPDTNDLNIKIINRYSGYYNPIFKDILFYNNFDENCPYSNTSFDYEYEDIYGRFGVINNMWYHKVNEDKSIEIINTLTPFYPLTGQYALDYRDYNIFSSSWDKNYFTKQMDISHKKSCENIASMKNDLCMFGSKYLNVPERIEIETFTDGGEWNDEWITNPNACKGNVMYKEINNNNVNFYLFLHKRILDYFYEHLKDEFARYINPEYSYGVYDIEDDIKEYISKNILKLYKLEKVRVFVKRTKRGIHNNRIENEYGENLNKTVATLRTNGFAEIKNVTISKVNVDDFDRKIVYNLRNGEQEDFGFSFIIKKI